MDVSTWRFNDSEWHQKKIGDFQLSKLHGSACSGDLTAPLASLIGAGSHPASADACSIGAYPAEFRYCPNCGVELTIPSGAGSNAWIPPYGDGSGLKVSPVELDAPITSLGQNFTLPASSGKFSFAVVALNSQRRLLIGVRRDTGQLSVFREKDPRRWAALEGRIGDSSLPDWSWAMASSANESALILPSDSGPVWCTIEWATGKVLADRFEGMSRGGPARLGKSVYAPVVTPAGLIIVSRADGDAAWSVCDAEADVLTTDGSNSLRLSEFFAVPLVDETRQVVYWVCSVGYVKVSRTANAALATWRFRPWRSVGHNPRALVELGPAYRKTSSRPGFWQLCEDQDPSSRDGIVNRIIKIDGDEAADTEVVEAGQFMTTGRASFSWLYDYWTDIHQLNSNAQEQSELRYPLLQFGEKGLVVLAKVRPWEGREDLGLLTDIVNGTGQRARVMVRFALQGNGEPERALSADGIDGAGNVAGSVFPMSLAQLCELSVFLFDSYLYIILPEENQCYRWPVQSRMTT